MKQRIFFLLGIAMLFSACQQDMIIELPVAEPKVTVNSFFKTDSVFQLNLSRSRAPLEDQYFLKYIDSARVEIFQGGVIIDSLISLGDGNYAGTKLPVAGGTYALRVSAAGFTEVTAIETLPQQAVISNLVITDSANVSEWGGYEAEISFSIVDPGGIENFYGIALRTIDTMLVFGNGPEPDTVVGTQQQYFSSVDPLLSESGTFFDDKTFNGTTRQFKITVQQDVVSGRVPFYFNLFAVSRKGYDYEKSLQSHLNAQGNPFAEPVQVYSNVLEGYGIFIGAVTNEVQLR